MVKVQPPERSLCSPLDLPKVLIFHWSRLKSFSSFILGIILYNLLCWVRYYFINWINITREWQRSFNIAHPCFIAGLEIRVKISRTGSNPQEKSDLLQKKTFLTFSCIFTDRNCWKNGKHFYLNSLDIQEKFFFF